MKKLLIGTRKSHLAMTQSGMVAEAIRQAHEGLEVELVSMTTRGDRHRGPLWKAGGKGLFTRELEQALRDGSVQLAVHSAKDLPADMEPDFTIAAVPRRADPRDALVGRFDSLSGLRSDAVVGTGSPRRGAQLLALRDDLQIVPLRGNVETRMNEALADDAEMDAVVLAMAGLIRGGLAEARREVIHPLDAEDCIPAGGQGVLAIQAMADNAEAAELLAPLEDPASRAALVAERRVLHELGADCHSCVAIHLAPEQGQWRGRAMVARPDGSDMIRLECFSATADEAAGEILTALDRHGAAELLSFE